MYGLSDQNIVYIQQVFELFPEIEQVILYGSRAKGNFKMGSDIDLTLLGKDLNLTLLNKVDNILDDLYLPYFFDISIFNQIKNVELLDHINQVGELFYTKSDLGNQKL
jgi:predicted nucleotidyltransferase